MEIEYLSENVNSTHLSGIQNFLTSFIVLSPPHITRESQIEDISLVSNLFVAS